jgi:Putative hydroxyindole-O-methyltransferase.
VHKDDYSVTRSEKILKGILSSRLFIIFEELQPNFPENLFKVKLCMFAFKKLMDINKWIAGTNAGF